MPKQEIRIIAWDDCRFRFEAKKVRIVGVVYRGGSFMDGLLSTTITKDGLDATEKISAAVRKSRHYDQLSLIMLDGISFGGFNLVDMNELRRKTWLPVIAVQRKKPDIKKFVSAMRIFEDYKKRVSIVNNAGKFYKFKKMIYQCAGLGQKECEDILDIACIRSNIPEPIRVAHLIASGLSGESRGRA